MPKHIRRPSPALVISLLALFVALGGVGYAAVVIDGKNLKNKSVAGKKLKNKTVTAGKIKNKTITGGKVKSNTLTGTQVNEAKLGKVPSAAAADTAGSASNAANSANSALVNGNSIRAVNFAVEAPIGNTVILNNFHGLTLTANCAAGPVITVTATSSVNGAQFVSHSMVSAGEASEEVTNDLSDDTFNIADPPKNLLATNTNLQNGKTHYLNPNGKHVTVLWSADDFATGPDCEFNGFAIGS